MRAVSIWAASCAAGLVTFSCFGDSDDDETTTGGKGGVTPEGGASDTGGRPGSGGATGGSASGGDATGGAEGTYDTCCIDNRTSECFCPAGTACNFGWFTDFYPDGSCCMQGDSICSNGGAGGGGAGGGAGASGGGGGSGGDGGNPVIAGRSGGGGEGGGSWEMCCEDGITDQCFCPGGVACNFGADVDFLADGSCCYFTVDDANDPNSCTAGGGAGGGGGSAGSSP